MNHKIITFTNIKLSQKNRLDKTLADLLEKENISRTKIKKIIEEKGVIVNKELTNDPKFMVEVIDFLEIVVEEEVKNHLIPKSSKSFDIIYEDQDLIVINKYAGITTHPGAGNYQDTLANELSFYSKELSSINGDFRPGLVHTLDKVTSGLLVIAKNDTTHFKLSEQLKSRELSRKYIAICYGVPMPRFGTITTYIARDPKNRVKMAVSNNKNGKEAVTIYKVLETFDDQYSLVELTLKTGRTHQIRVHMTHLKHSLVGDDTYKSRDINKYKKLDFPRQALHAYSIGFIHPNKNEEMRFEIPLPSDMASLIAKLREPNE